MKFVTVKVSCNLNLMQSLSTQLNQLGDVFRGWKLIRYVFSKVIECLEQNIRKQIDYKRPSNTPFSISNQKFKQSPRKTLIC